MRVGYQLAVVLVGAEARVNAVIVGRGIAVIGAGAVLAVGRVVLQHGREPKGRHAQLGEVVQMVPDALQVTAVAQAGLRAVFHVGVHALHLRLVVLALGEAVGHQHVEHVGVGETLALLSRHGTGLEPVAHFLLALAHREAQLHLARLRPRQVQVDQEIVGRVEPHQGVHPHAGIIGGDLRLAYTLAIDHQLQRRVFHAHVPIGGLHAVYLHRGVHAQCRHDKTE